MPEPTAMLVLRGVSKRYGAVVALDEIDLAAEAGQVVAVLGPNGAGKTTMLSIIAGLRRPTRGEVRIDGIDMTRAPRSAGRSIGFVPQEVGIYPRVSTFEN